MVARNLTTKQLDALSAKLRPARDDLLLMHGRAIEERWDEVVEPVQAASLAVGELVAMLERMGREKTRVALLAGVRTAEPAGDPRCGADRRTLIHSLHSLLSTLH